MMKKIMMMLTALLTISLSACIPALCTPTRSLSQSKSSKKATIGAFRAYFQLATALRLSIPTPPTPSAPSC